MEPGKADATAWTLVVHPDDLPRGARAPATQTLASGETFEVEYRFRAADGSYRWHLGRAMPMLAEDGSIEFWIGTATDIHDRRRTEDMQRFLLEAGEELGGSLDFRTTLAAVARLAVPEVADWCAVHILEDDGTIQELAVAHADPAKIVFARELQERYPAEAEGQSGPAAVIRSGTPELVSEVTDEMLEAAARDEIHLGLIRELGISSYLCVPLEARGRTRRGDHARLGGVGPSLRRARPPAGEGARAARGHGGRQRPALRPHRAPGARRPRARHDRRRRRARRPRGGDPPLQHGGPGDLRRRGERDCRPVGRGGIARVA